MARRRSGASRTWGAGELAELYAAHRLSLVRLAILLVDDLASAEDVVQDAFTAMAARRGTLDDRSAALDYLRISVVNGSRSALRRRRTARATCRPTRRRSRVRRATRSSPRSTGTVYRWTLGGTVSRSVPSTLQPLREGCFLIDDAEPGAPVIRC